MAIKAAHYKDIFLFIYFSGLSNRIMKKDYKTFFMLN